MHVRLLEGKRKGLCVNEFLSTLRRAHVRTHPSAVESCFVSWAPCKHWN